MVPYSRHRDWGVSIHASSREDATFKLKNLSFKLKFQSTRPRGRTRRRVIIAVSEYPSFNPRVLAGGRDDMKPLI